MRDTSLQGFTLMLAMVVGSICKRFVPIPKSALPVRASAPHRRGPQCLTAGTL
jgi:hypothetical protein